ncbi:hydroxyproline-rich glycoprotein family protein [Trema orientale]|uniref:Hydroxyproline-rich glycoprotein family protein n=1 Tax=Trema orientale TaxID=63057 RepID=A0A2P5FK70_TREOI|nr:hydroxyproline-rich glycoprotein family protein [Trema orientale]
MAAAAPSRLLSTLFLATIVLNFPRATLSDDPCQYPCYPPPTGTVTPTTPSTIPPPSPQTGSTGFYPPPATGGVYPTPNYPYNPPPYGGGSFGAQPPPPDPILPYFPFYYKEPLHRSPDDQSSSATLGLGGSTNLIMTMLFFFFFYHFP